MGEGAYATDWVRNQDTTRWERVRIWPADRGKTRWSEQQI